MADMLSNDLIIRFKSNIERSLFKFIFIEDEVFSFDRIIPFYQKRNIIYYIIYLFIISILRFDLNIFKIFLKELKDIKNKSNRIKINRGNLPRDMWGCKREGQILNIIEEDKILKIYFDTPYSPPDSILYKLSNIFELECISYGLDQLIFYDNDGLSTYDIDDYIIRIDSLGCYYNFDGWEAFDKYYNSIQKEELIEMLLNSDCDDIVDEACEQLLNNELFTKIEINRINKKRLCNLLNEKE